jgi:hypothetical protein
MAAEYRESEVQGRKRQQRETSSALVILNFTPRHEKRGIKRFFPRLSKDMSQY